MSTEMISAISIWQPYASAIACDLKFIETRPRRTHVRGWVALHASKCWSPIQRSLAESIADYSEALKDALARGALPLGAVVAVGYLHDCQPTESLVMTIDAMERDLGNYAPGRWGWMFKDIRPLRKPLAWKGSQGWFGVPLDAVNEQLVTPVDVKQK